MTQVTKIDGNSLLIPWHRTVVGSCNTTLNQYQSLSFVSLGIKIDDIEPLGFIVNGSYEIDSVCYVPNYSLGSCSRLHYCNECSY